MKIVKVDTIPNVCKSKPKNNIRKLLEEFLALDTKYARIIFEENEYGNIDIARMSIRNSSIRHGFPIGVVFRQSEMYLVRKDM